MHHHHHSKFKTRYSSYLTDLFFLKEVKLALFNFIFAKKNYGSFALRFNDFHEKDKSKKKTITNALDWLNITYDEEFLADKIELFRSKAEELIKRGFAYPDLYCIEIKGKNRTATPEESWNIYSGNKKAYQLRFKVPEGNIIFNDLVQGKVKWNLDNERDFLIFDTTNPSAVFADCISDGENNITHVIQEKTAMSGIPAKLLLMEVFGYNTPVYAHLPVFDINPEAPHETKILLNKISRLNSHLYPTLFEFYQTLGFISEAIIEWLVGDCSFNKNYKKLEFDDALKINKKYMNEMNFSDHVDKCTQFVKNSKLNVPDLEMLGIVSTCLTHLNLHSEILNHSFFFKEPTYDEFMLKSCLDQPARIELNYLPFLFEDVEPWNHRNIELVLKDRSDEMSYILKVVITGSMFGPTLLEIMYRIGKSECIKRIKSVLKKYPVKEEDLEAA